MFGPRDKSKHWKLRLNRSKAPELAISCLFSLANRYSVSGPHTRNNDQEFAPNRGCQKAAGERVPGN